MEIKYDLGLVRMNNFSREQYENNITVECYYLKEKTT